MGTFVLGFFLFLAIFAATAFAVLYYRANLLTESAEKKAEEANAKAEKIEEAYLKIKKTPEIVLEKVKKYEQIAKAIENRIHGYGDEYLLPIESVIDELGAKYAFTEPGKQLKAATKTIKGMIKEGEAASCQLEDKKRRVNAIEFILDAFLGKAEAIIAKAKSDNFGKLKQQLIDSFTLVNLNALAFKTAINQPFLDAYIEKLKWASILQKLKKTEQEEQRVLREKMREDERVRKEAEKAQKEALKEEEAVQKALAIAYEKMAKSSEEEKEKYEQQIKELNDRVAAAEEKRQRAMSMAQQTKMGHVYIISNVGSLGEDVFKIGMTRRLDPQERVDELGDSSVPFSFDVHALIKSEDAPGLEHQLHKIFLFNQVNKMNHRKEFFRVPLTKIKEEVEKLGLEAVWTMAAEAQQYKETLYIEKLIAEDPEAREKWATRQLEMDDIDLGGGYSGEGNEEDEED